MTQTWPCANCGGPLTVADNFLPDGSRGLITVNVGGHAKPAHRTCPEPKHDCTADDNIGCAACVAEGAQERVSWSLGGEY